MSTTQDHPSSPQGQQGSGPTPDAAPTHVPAPQYPQAPYRPEPWRAKNWMGVTSLVLSLLGLVTGITAIAGIVFGHLSLSAVKHGEADNRSVGLAGLIVGYVLTALGLAVIVLVMAVAGWAITECAGSDPADWCTSTA